MPGLVHAVSSAFVGLADGADYFVQAGQTFPADHPIVAGRESLFVEHDPGSLPAAELFILPPPAEPVPSDDQGDEEIGPEPDPEPAEEKPGTRRARR
jgi:hypothetical protein